MAKRPAQGRGSGGRVTPSPRSSAAGESRPAGRGRGRVMQAPPPKKPASAKTPGSSTPTADEDRPRSSRFPLARLFDPAGAAGVPAPERTRPWWGFGDVLLWWLLGYLGAQVVLGIVVVQGGYRTLLGRGARLGEGVGQLLANGRVLVGKTLADLPLWVTQVVGLLPLWAAFIGGAVVATTRKGFGPVKDLKIAFRPIDVPVGLVVGVFGQLVLTPLIYWVLFRFTGEQDVSAAARGITDKATSPALVVLVFCTVGFVAPVAEELFFRGLALQSLIRRFGPAGGLLASSAFFAAVHLSPLLFVALMPFAMLLAGLVLFFDRLGPAIVAHVAFNLVTATVLLFDLEASLPW